MDFSSMTGFLDPSKWQQQLNYQGGGSGSGHNPPPPPPPPPPQMGSGGGGGSGGGTGLIRPNSMANQARIANIPMQDTPLKCPRCESTNTKFCYYNNYSLLQPRHFCKTCRRYWTRGGALRSVPVGGGCRRNKRSTKSTANKSPASSGDQQSTPSASASALPSISTGTSNLLGLASQFPPLHLMAPFGHFSDHQFGLNYGGNLSSTPVTSNQMNYQMGSIISSNNNDNNLFGESGVGIQQWRGLQNFPFMGGMDPPLNGLYPFQGGDSSSGYVGSKVSASVISQTDGSVKMEDNNNNTMNQEMNLSRRLLGVDQWNGGNGGGWPDISGFTSSTSNIHHL